MTLSVSVHTEKKLSNPVTTITRIQRVRSMEQSNTFGMDLALTNAVPDLIDGRLFLSVYKRNPNVLKICIQEYLPSLVTDSCQKVYRIQVSETLGPGRLIGQPTCLACRDDVLVYMYSTEKFKYIRFFIVNLSSQVVHHIEDKELYFRRNCSPYDRLRGLICPDRKTILVRLPELVLSNHKWSKIMQTCYKDSDEMNIDELEDCTRVLRLVPSFIQDRKFLALAAHPKKQALIFTALIDDYCSKFILKIYDLQTGKIVNEKRHRLNQDVQNMKRRRLYCSDDSSDSDGDIHQLTLSSASITFSHEGDLLVLVYVAERDGRHCLIVGVYDEDMCLVKTFHCDICSWQLDVDRLQVFISKDDEECYVYRYSVRTSGASALSSLFWFKWPRTINLKRLCRSVIIKTVPISLVQNLPCTLQNFLRLS